MAHFGDSVDIARVLKERSSGRGRLKLVVFDADTQGTS